MARRSCLILLCFPLALGAAWPQSEQLEAQSAVVHCDLQLATSYQGPVLLKVSLSTGHSHSLELPLDRSRVTFEVPPGANQEGVLEVPGHAAARLRWRVDAAGALRCVPQQLEAAAKLNGHITSATPETRVTACGRTGQVAADGTYQVEVTAGEICDVWAERPGAGRSQVRTAISEHDAPAYVVLALP